MSKPNVMMMTQKPDTEQPDDSGMMPLMAHLIELRKRLFLCLCLFVVASGVCYCFAETILAFLAAPLLKADAGPGRLIYTGLTEAFMTFVKVSCFSGAILSLPFILNQCWRFVAPALYAKERRFLWPFFVISPCLFFGGLLFAYYLILPPAWSFFLAFQKQAAQSGLALALEARVAEYVSLSMQILLAFSVCFQLPVVLVLLGRLGVISSVLLIKGRRYAFLLILIVSAILTPPDVLSMIGLACALYALYELSIYLIKGLERRQQKKESDVRYQVDP